jgi:hypothetical protein
MHMATIGKLAGPVLGALVLLVTAGCSRDGGTNASNAAINGGVPRLDARDGFPTAPTGSLPVPPAAVGSANCAQGLCTITLTPAQDAVDALGTHVTLDALQANRAILGVGNDQVGCIQGETVFAQPFSLTCSRIGGGQVAVVLVRGD